MRLTERLSLRIVATTTILVGGALVATMLTTTPDKLGPFGITVWFLGMLVGLGGVLAITVYYISKVLRPRADKAGTFSRSLRLGTLGSIWVSALVAQNSLRQLGLKDIVLVSLLVGLIEFYLRRTQ